MQTQRLPSIPAREKVALSLKAVAVGWGVFFVVLCCLVADALIRHSSWTNGTHPLVILLLGGLGSAAVVLAVWLVVALPLALLVPDDSAFWKPAVLTVVGLAAGPVAVVLGAGYQLMSNPTISIREPDIYLLGGVMFPGIPAAIIGGITGAAAARLHKKARGG